MSDEQSKHGVGSRVVLCFSCERAPFHPVLPRGIANAMRVSLPLALRAGLVGFTAQQTGGRRCGVRLRRLVFRIRRLVVPESF